MKSGLKDVLQPFLFGGAKKQSEQKTGLQGEDIAVSYLKTLGYAILARNYRQRFGEIDIVARDGSVLVFVEVKTRKNRSYGSPFEAVDGRKQLKLSRMALDYLSRNNLTDHAARFDVVAVLLDSQAGPAVEHIQNAFDLQE